jgi:hypothetical protein
VVLIGLPQTFLAQFTSSEFIIKYGVDIIGLFFLVISVYKIAKRN